MLLYGPPGCGKTLLARAIAGECGLPFPAGAHRGRRRPLLRRQRAQPRRAFAEARDAAPCVVFIDEVDALGYSRVKAGGESGRRLADVMLQQLDSVGTDTSGLLVLAATNAPWDVDDALLRPGRFDRRVLVPPPDAFARQRVLDVLLRGVPTAGVDTGRLAAALELFSGADLQAVVERAVDEVIEEALGTGQEPPLRQAQLERCAQAVRPTALEWLARARDYVEFSNATERWADVADYLRRKEVRRWLAGAT